MLGAGDVFLRDMGHGLNFRPNTFDGCVSISAVQWLCNAYDKSQVRASSVITRELLFFLGKFVLILTLGLCLFLPNCNR
jgi:hypothetical protein